MKFRIIGLMLGLALSAYAHDLFTYTDTLNVTDKEAVNAKILFGHPEGGKNFVAVDAVMYDGKPNMPAKAIVYHNGEIKDITSSIKEAKLNSDRGMTRIFEYSYGKADGLVGQGTWIFAVDTGLSKGKHGISNTLTKLIVTKEKAGKDKAWNKRIADGYPEIIPYVDPTDAWKENGFRGKIVDANGNGIPGVVLHASQVNGKVEGYDYIGGASLPKTRIDIVSDDNGMFEFTPSREGLWIVAGLAENKEMRKNTNLLIEFK